MGIVCMINKKSIALSWLILTLLLPSTTQASELGTKIKNKVKLNLEQSQIQSQEQTQIIENNNTNNNENNNYIENSTNPEINISNGSESFSDSYITPAVVYSKPQVIYTDSSYPVEELPKTGLPALGLILASLLPTGLGLKKFQQKTTTNKSANYIWEEKQFLK